MQPPPPQARHARIPVVWTFMLSFCVPILLSSCAQDHLQAYRVPGADLRKIRSIYVVTIQGDAFNVDRMIADRLAKMGFQASYGPRQKAPEAVDAIITYEDRWMWDITMYLLKLSIRVQTGSTNLLIAKGESFRTSLLRKTPEEMVEEALFEIFK